MAKVKRGKVVSYNKWGYIFLIPFIVVYLIFQLVPLFRTFYYSFFENYRSGLTQIGPNFVGLQNFITIFKNPDLYREHIDHVDHGIYSADYCISGAGGMVLGSQPQIKRTEIL